ncbi:MAG: hypothetical protein PVF54_09230 [Anaerolineae bacterium]|jgi:hypothetical protein
MEEAICCAHHDLEGDYAFIVRVRDGELVVLTSDGASLRLVEEIEGWSGSGPRRRSTRDSLLDCAQGLGPVAGGGTEQDPRKNRRAAQLKEGLHKTSEAARSDGTLAGLWGLLDRRTGDLGAAAIFGLRSTRGGSLDR